ncbi:hypothetical protein F4808DRAFT_429737 [Astrocystis sublimbata]|nr:hypothetical protein F4808DRAFT_429737 [Astrocystis sublimbata]
MKHIANRALVPEACDCVGDANEGLVSNQSKGNRRRLKQKVRRQTWRSNERKAKTEAEKEIQQKILDFASSLPHYRPRECDTAFPHRQPILPLSRLSAMVWEVEYERTLMFLMDLFKYDTRSADWDLVCSELGEYTAFPHCQSVLPLSRLSALVWEVEYEGRRWNSSVEENLEKVEYILIQKECKLTFYKRHKRSCDHKSEVWSKCLRSHKSIFSVEVAMKALCYGQLVLQRVIVQLEKQQQELLHLRQILDNSSHDYPVIAVTE